MDNKSYEKVHINEVTPPKPLIEYLKKGEGITPEEKEEFLIRYALQPENILNELYYLEEFDRDFASDLAYLPTLLEDLKPEILGILRNEINADIPEDIFGTARLAGIVIATGVEKRLDHEHGKYNQTRLQISSYYESILEDWIDSQETQDPSVIFASAYKLLCAGWITDRAECVDVTLARLTSNRKFMAKFQTHLYSSLQSAQGFMENILGSENRYKSIVRENEEGDPARRLLLAASRNHRYKRALIRKFNSAGAFDDPTLRATLSIVSHEERAAQLFEEGELGFQPIIMRALTIRFLQEGDLLSLKDLYDFLENSETRGLNSYLWASGVPDYTLPRDETISADEFTKIRRDAKYAHKFTEYAKKHKQTLKDTLKRLSEKKGRIKAHERFVTRYSTYLNQIVFSKTYQEREHQILERRLEVAEYLRRIKLYGYEGISFQGDEFSTEDGENQELAALGIDKLTVWFAPWRIPSLGDGYLVKIDLKGIRSKYDHYYYIDDNNNLRLVTTNKAKKRDDLIVLGNSLVEKQACEREKILHLSLEHIAAIKLGKRDERMCAVRTLPTIREHETDGGQFQEQIPSEEELAELTENKTPEREPAGKKKKRTTSSHLQALPSGVPRGKYSRDQIEEFARKYKKVGYYFSGDLFESCMTFIDELEAAGVKFASNFKGADEDGNPTVDTLIARLVIEGQTTFVQFLHRLRVAEAKHGEERAVQLYLHNRNNFDYSIPNKVTFIRNQR